MDRSWMSQAACAAHPHAGTWITPRARSVPEHIARTCQACPVKQDCLADEVQYAASTFRWVYQPAGYRAGLTPSQIKTVIHEYLRQHPVRGEESHEASTPGRPPA